jgi:hypothetical protein
MSSLVYSVYGRLRQVEPEKLWTYVLTTILVLALYTSVLQVTFTEPRFDVEKFAEIDFTKFQPPKPVTHGREDKPKEKVSKVIEETVAPTNAAPHELPQIDLTTLETLAQVVDNSPKDLAMLQRTAALPSALEIQAINAGTTMMPALNAPVVQTRPHGLPVLGAPSNVFTPKLETPKKGYGGSRPSGEGYSTGRPVTIPNGHKKDGHTNTIKIEVKDDPYGEKNWHTRDLKKLFHELLEWMRNHPYDLPPALKQYMRYKNGDVTSRVGILTAETEYELFMLCNEASEDFGLLLVAAGDSTQAICLRDTGFRKQSFYLSKGIAGRNESAAVGSVSMLEQRPTRQETSKFYNIFLSWWDTTKAGGQKKT